MSVQHLHTNQVIPYVISMKTLMKVSYDNLNEILYVSVDRKSTRLNSSHRR